ncbi:MAG: hypothetical protein IBJ19_18515, partial [Gemmatimonadaceae bacterium]|nr:hypothetical protein [Gemmatimonadaceae bacterium]
MGTDRQSDAPSASPAAPRRSTVRYARKQYCTHPAMTWYERADRPKVLRCPAFTTGEFLPNTVTGPTASRAARTPDYPREPRPHLAPRT